MIYKISNLLQFYLVTMKRTIGAKALLCDTLQEQVTPASLPPLPLLNKTASTIRPTPPFSKCSILKAEASCDSCT